MAGKNFVKVILATLLTVALVMCAVPCVLATETAADETSGADVLLSAPADTEGEAADTSAAEDTSAETEAAGTDTEKVADTAESGADTSTTGADEEKGGISTGTIIGIAIVALIVIFGAIFCIKNREKVAKFFREVRSECKKIVWTPWKTVRKNTFVVIIIMIICAIAIGALDYLFSKGIIALGNII